MGTLKAEWPCKLVSLPNVREHWGTRAARAKAHRTAARAMIGPCVGILRAGAGKTPLPLVVTITRIGKRKLETDNLVSSAKNVRDGVADALGVDDGDERITWLVRQEVGKQYAVRVEISRPLIQPGSDRIQ